MMNGQIGAFSLAKDLLKVRNKQYTLAEQKVIIQELTKAEFNQDWVDCLYHLVINKSPHGYQQMTLVDQSQFGLKLPDWINKQSKFAYGLHSFSKQTYLYILELLGFFIELSQQFPNFKEKILSTSKEVLISLQGIIRQGLNYDLLQKNIACIAKMFSYDRYIIDIKAYAHMLNQTNGNLEEFHQFFYYYLQQNKQHDGAIVHLILDGFDKRMKMFLGRTCIIPPERRRILKIYNSLNSKSTHYQVFLKQNLDSDLAERIMNQYPQIYNSLIDFAHMRFDFDHKDLCREFTKVVDLYLSAPKILYFHKFAFVLRLYMRIFSHIPLASGYISTAPLIRDMHFTKWFISSELRQEKRQQVIQTYFKYPDSLQFLLEITTNAFKSLPQHADHEHVYCYLRSIDLMQKSTKFLSKEVVQSSLEQYYFYAGDPVGLANLHKKIQEMGL